MHCYNIPTIDPDLRHEETILQAINAFEFLNEVIEDVFGKVNRRIESNRERLQRLNDRIEKVNGDVARLRETKEAIVIYSPCRYPGADLDTAVLPTFTRANGIRMRDGDEAGVLRDRPYVPSHSYQEKIQFYHVKSSAERHRIYPFEGGTEVQARPDVQFLDSILLFNSQDFAEDFKGAAEKSRSGRKTPSKIREERILSSSSPIIRNRSKKKGQEIFYTPVLNDAPKIDVPVDLPDLPGIVSNIQYAGNNTLIAPSLQLAAIADQLPELEDLSTTEAKETVPPPVPSSTTPVSTLPTVVPTASTVTALGMAPPAPPPPPPPPPPPAEILEPTQRNDHRKSDESDGKPTAAKREGLKPTAAGGDAHFNLMEAIRKAGGVEKANLRHSSETKEGRTDSTKPSKAKPQNFIDDLHSKLQMRRKGISGARENQEPGNVIDRLSALIPPPPPKLDASASESNDEDWD